MTRQADRRDGSAAIAWALFGAALALRVVYVLQLRASPLSSFPVLDELYHVEWARAIAAGDWVGSDIFFRAPLYPYTLGVLFAVFHGSLLAARMAQAAYSALLPVAVFFLGNRVFGRRVAVAGGIVALLYPFFIYFSQELLIVSLVVLLDVVLVIAALRADQTGGRLRWLAVGLVGGASAVARPSILIFVPALLIWMWWRERSGNRPVGESAPALRRVLPSVMLVLLGIAAVVAPVTVRNYVVGKDLVPIASQGGINFFIGNNSTSDGASAVLPVLGESWQNEDAERVAEAQLGRHLKPSEVSSFWFARGRDFIIREPGTAVRLYLRKLVLFWDSYELANNKDIYYFGRMSAVFRWFSWLNFGLIAPLAILGMFVSLRRNPAAVLLALFVSSYMCGVLLFFVNSRFRLPVVPFLILFAAAAVRWLLLQIAQRRARSLLLALAALAALAFFVNYDFYSTHAGDRAQTHMTLGRAAAAQGHHGEALREYRRAIEISPGYAKAYNSMGLALEQLGRDDEALETYLRASEIDSTLATVRNNIGSLLLRRGDPRSAARWFEDAIAIDPYLEQAHMNLAVILAENGRLEDAEYHLKCAVTAEPAFKEAWDALGRLFEQTGRLPEAASAYARAISIDPSYVEARRDLGVVLAMGGRYREAIVELEAAHRLRPNDAGIASDLAKVRGALAAESTQRAE
ncbi:MAG: tetratricopeptide repeat protein [Candidatus Eisenbacteria bacterium]|nr:tetratricopeptide repeat protein [Candidatus Eisenbacteria bacterium]